MKLSKKQTDAVQAMVCSAKARKYHLLTGYSGTGKTTVTSSLIKELLDQDLDVIMCAPTHKACEVVRDMLLLQQIYIEVKTIHSLLNLKPVRQKDGKYKLSNRGSVDYFPDVLIIDEVSMLDQELVNYIHKFKISHKCAVIMVGDKAQIPPVSQNPDELSPVFDLPSLGLQSFDLLGFETSAEFPGISDRNNLTKIFRTAKKNPILKIATKLRDHIDYGKKFPELNSVNDIKDRSGIISVDHSAFWRQIRSGISAGSDITYIGYTNRATLSAAKSMRLQKLGDVEWYQPGETYISNNNVMPFSDICEPDIGTFNKRLVQERYGMNNARQFFENNIHLTTAIKNNRDKNVFLSFPAPMPSRSLQFVKAQADFLDQRLGIEQIDGYWIVFSDLSFAWQPKDQKQIAEIKSKVFKTGHTVFSELDRLESFLDLRLPYSITAHKSQGSTFDVVAVDLDDMNSMLRHSRQQLPRLLYTAITRASRLVLLGGKCLY